MSRQTFYAHYSDIDALSVDALRDELEDLRAISRETGELTADADDPIDPPPGLTRLARFVDEHRPLLVRALGRDGSPGFAHWLRELVAADVAEGLRRRQDRVHDAVPLAVQARFVTGALLGTLLPTTTDTSQSGPDDLAMQVWTLLRPVVGVASVTAARDG